MTKMAKMTRIIRPRKILLQFNTLLIIAVIGFFGAAFSLPILVTITNSFMTAFEIANRYSMAVLPTNYFRLLADFDNFNFVDMALVPAWASLGQYFAILVDAVYLGHLWNSILITVPSLVGQLLIAIPAAYALELSQWRHKEKLFFVYIIVMLMPLPVVLVPQFVVTGFLGIRESVLAIILPAAASPFGVFLLRQFLKTISMECLEAAKIDGASHTVILLQIVTPLLKPAIAALAILVFIDYWNVVEQAIIFLPTIAQLPLSVTLTHLNPDVIFAASCFYMIPALLVFMYGQEYLIDGIQLSGLK